MVEEHMDPVHGLVIINEPSCLAALQALEKEWERLKDIRALGVIGEVVGPATHSKREHHIGMYHLSKEVAGLTTAERKRLGLVCLLRGLGHLPLTYSTEEGVVLAARLSGECKKTLVARLAAVEDACRRRKLWSGEEDPIERLVEQHDYKELYKWLSAAKVVEARLGDNVGVHVDALVMDLVFPGSPIYAMAEELARIDYVQRDVYYSGVAELRLEPRMVLDGFAGRFGGRGGMGGRVEPPDPELGLIREARAYLYERLYGMKDVLGLDACVKKEVAALLVRGALEVGQLMEWTDHKLCSRLGELAAEDKDLRDVASLRRIAWTVVAQSRLQPGGAPLPEVERRVVGCELAGLVSYPQRLGYVVSVLEKPEGEGAVTVLGEMGARRFAPFAAAAAALETLGFEGDGRPILGRSAEEHGADLLAFAFGARVSADFDGVEEAAQRWLRGPGAETVGGLLSEAVESPESEKWPAVVRMMASFGPGFLRDVEGAAEVAASLLHKRGVGALRQRMAKAMLEDSRRKEAGEWLPAGGKGQELRVYLKLLARMDPASTSWVLPNVSIAFRGGAGKMEEYEVNLVTIDARASGARIVLYECSTEKGEQKALADMEKGLRLKRRLSGRFDDLEVDAKVLGGSRVGSKFLDAEKFLR
jgi:HD superfamily phosphohydrolase